MTLGARINWDMVPQAGETEPSPGPRSGIGENLIAVGRSQAKVHSTMGLEYMLADELQKRDDEIFSMTGQRPGAHYPKVDFDELKKINKLPTKAWYSMSGMPEDVLQRSFKMAMESEARIDELRKQYPGIRTRQQVIEAVKARRAEIEGEAEDVQSRAGFWGGVGGFVGGMGGSFTLNDPLNIATLPIGGFGKSLLQRMGTEAATQMAIEGVNQHSVAKDFKSLGDELPAGQQAMSILFAGAGGALFPALARGGRAGWEAITKRAEKNDRVGRALARVVSKTTPEERAAEIRAMDEDTQRAVAEFVTPAKTDAERGALAEAEGASLLAKAYGLVTTEMQSGMREHAAMLDKVQDAVENDAPLPPQPNAQVSEDAYKRTPVKDYSADELLIDAKTMQFKSGGDDAGVTERLRGVTEWNDYLAGTITVWVRKDGTVVVGDGHQRVGLAKRIMAQNPERKITLPAFVFREDEGATAGFVRATAALRNISEGSGSPLDAARVFREMPENARKVYESLPPNSQLVRQGQSLATLDNEAFMMVVNGVVDEKIGAVVGRLESSPDRQRALMSLLAKEEPDTIFQAEQIVRQAQEIGFTSGEQVSLFGSETVAETLFKERAKVLERALRIIKDDERVFKNLTKNSSRIKAAGNELDDIANMDNLAMSRYILKGIEVSANRRGVIADALTEAAKGAKANGRYKQAAEQFAAVIRERLDESRLSGLFDGSEGGLSDVAAEVRRRITGDQQELGLAATKQIAEEHPKTVEVQYSELKALANSQREIPSEAKASGDKKPVKGKAPEVIRDLTQRPERQTTTRVELSESFSTAKISPSYRSGGTKKSRLGVADPVTGKKVLHTQTKINQLLAEAQSHVEPLKEWMSSLASDVRGMNMVGVRVKTPEGAKTKADMLDRPADQVSDYLGARLSFDTTKAKDDFLAKLREEADIIDYEDFLIGGRGGNGTGYRAIHLQAMTANGFSYEVQIIPREVMDVYYDGRGYYDKWKEYRGKLTPEQVAEKAKDFAKGDAIYDKAWREFQERDLREKNLREFNPDQELPWQVEFDADGAEKIITKRLGDVVKEIDEHEDLLARMSECLL